MDKTSEATNPAQSKTHLLLPGRFDYIHPSHFSLIREIKASFPNPYLTIGIMHNNFRNSLHTLAEKLEILQTLEDIDDIKVLRDTLTDAQLEAWQVKYVIATKEFTDDWTFSSEAKYDDTLSEAKMAPLSHSPSQRAQLQKKVKGLLQFMKACGQRLYTHTEAWLENCRFQLQRFVGAWSPSHECALVQWVNDSRRTWPRLFYALKSSTARIERETC